MKIKMQKWTHPSMDQALIITPEEGIEVAKTYIEGNPELLNVETIEMTSEEVEALKEFEG